ncbi:hypothetical protein CC86DRAFT_102710 [Ophiobolus disseminans]|uniref:Uncharacterized protein n=1 Tax=Ophiobolus disseminans TaxID=1469910 RepID=A0A6A6ZKB6_9PLEO|nr:hypothetical protein CC86DRAFT_102710 [Ophiobolus disseminans]
MVQILLTTLDTACGAGRAHGTGNELCLPSFHGSNVAFTWREIRRRMSSFVVLMCCLSSKFLPTMTLSFTAHHPASPPTSI